MTRMVDHNGHAVDEPQMSRMNPDAQQIMAMWDHCRPYIAAAIEQGGEFCSIEYVEGRVAEGTAQLWPGRACALVTEVKQFDTATVLYLWLGGGDLKEIKHMVPLIESFAKKTWGCSRSVIHGRKGWKRVFPAYKDHSITIVKEI